VGEFLGFAFSYRASAETNFSAGGGNGRKNHQFGRKNFLGTIVNKMTK